MDSSAGPSALIVFLWILVGISALPVLFKSARQFWRNRFRAPVYIHAMALLAGAIGAWMAFAMEYSPVEGRLRQVSFVVIMPMLVYFGWLRFGGPLLEKRPRESSEDVEDQVP